MKFAAYLYKSNHKKNSRNTILLYFWISKFSKRKGLIFELICGSTFLNHEPSSKK